MMLCMPGCFPLSYWPSNQATNQPFQALSLSLSEVRKTSCTAARSLHITLTASSWTWSASLPVAYPLNSVTFSGSSALESAVIRLYLFVRIPYLQARCSTLLRTSSLRLAGSITSSSGPYVRIRPMNSRFGSTSYEINPYGYLSSS